MITFSSESGSYMKALVVNFTQTLEAGRKIKPSSFPFIIGRGQLWYEQIWLMFDKFVSRVLNLKVHRPSTGHMKTRKSSPTKMWREMSSSLSDWRAWCFGNCWMARAFKNENLSYRSGVVFLLHFYCNLFLMEFWHSHFLNRIRFILLLFRLVQHQVHAFFFFFFPIKNKQKTPSEKPIKPEQNKPIFLEAEVLVGKTLILEADLSQLDHNWSC